MKTEGKVQHLPGVTIVTPAPADMSDVMTATPPASSTTIATSPTTVPTRTIPTWSERAAASARKARDSHVHSYTKLVYRQIDAGRIMLLRACPAHPEAVQAFEMGPVEDMRRLYGRLRGNG